MGDMPPRHLRPLWDLVKDKGWSYDTTSSGHPRFTPPSGTVGPRISGRLAAPVTFSKTASDWRGDRNGFAAMRRLGVQVPGKGQR
jgi:hypothetical protein